MSLTVKEEAALYAVRYKWALEELTLDALYQECNRRNEAEMQYHVRRLFRSKRKGREVRRAGKLEECCEELALYRFTQLRTSAASMAFYLMGYYQCDLWRLVLDLRWLVSTQRGRRKTLGLVVDEPVPGKEPVQRKRKRKRSGWSL